MAPEPFTDHQWQELVEAAPSIARAVAAASGSLAQSEHELEAFLGLLERTRDDTAGDTLLGRLAADVHSRLSSGALGLAVDDVVADGIHSARQAGAVLTVEPDEHQARAVRYWLMEIARTVAGAARDGGIMGLGGQDVSRPERDVLAAIADGLGLGGAGEARGQTLGRDEEVAMEPGREDLLHGDEAEHIEEPPSAEAALGPDGQPIGPDNIRAGTVRGVLGGPSQSEGQGQGG